MTEDESEVIIVSGIGNKEIFARNLASYIKRSGKTQKELALEWNVATSTLNNWVMGKKYPRMDKVEMMANYFGILKSALIEEQLTDDQKANNEPLTGIITRLRMDADFQQIVETLNPLDGEKLKGVQQMLDAFTK